MDSVDDIVGFAEPTDDADRVSHSVIGAAIKVHKELGPGHPESAYQNALCIELKARGLSFVPQYCFTLIYKGQKVGVGRVDLLVEGCLIVEIKAIESFAAIHTSQVVSYLRATNKRLALLINFNVKGLKDGIKRVANTM